MWTAGQSQLHTLLVAPPRGVVCGIVPPLGEEPGGVSKANIVSLEG